MNPDQLALLHGYLSDTLDAATFAQLQSLLRESAEARRTLRSLATIDAHLHQLAAANPATALLLAHSPAHRAPTATWLTRHPQAAAVAGLILGLFCATMVFAYIAPALHKPLTLLETSFEEATHPLPNGVPSVTGLWAGDFSEIVGPQNGVTPRSGNKMWRFLRADNRTGAARAANYVGEAIHILDLSKLQSGNTSTSRILEISAWFALGNTSPGTRYHWNIKAAAFEGNVVDAPHLWGKWDDLNTCLVRREVIANQTPEWQPLSVTMMIPASATFLIFECAAVHRKPLLPNEVAEFPAHYLDDVRVRLLPQ